MQVDILGVDNIVKYIEATKKTKFSILRAGASAHMSVFECLDSDTNVNAVNDFKRWAEVMNNAIPYKIILFDFAEFTTDQNGEPMVKKQKNRSAKCEATFILNAFAQNQTTNQQTPEISSQGFDAKSFRESIINEIAKKQEENLILTELKKLTERINEIESEEEEEEEENGLGALTDTDQLAKIMGLVNMFKGEQKPVTINGANERTDNINNAIKRLYAVNKNLDTDLLKLADLAEQKPDTFNMLITTLRGM